MDRASRYSEGRITLRAVEAGDYEHLRRVELSSELAARWRLVDHPSPEDYGRSLWDGVQTQHLAFDTHTERCIGLFTVYAMDRHNRVARFAAARFLNSPSARLGYLVAFREILRLTFDTYDVRKLYMDVPEFNYVQIRSFVERGLFTLEGRLVDFRYLGRRYWDQYIVSIDFASLSGLDELIERLGL
jgi:hypothetical protein